LLLLTAACSPPPSADGSAANEITGGASDYDTNAVIVIIVNDTAASAVVVSSGLLITAAHAVHPTYTDGKADSVQLAFASRFVSDPEVMTVPYSKVHLHPAFDPKNVAAGHDIAVVELGSGTGNARGIRSLPFARAPLTTGIIGAPVRIVGYGGNDMYEGIHPNSVRTSVQTTVQSASDQLLVVGGAGAPQACVGDSGGPVLRKRDDGGEEVVALASFLVSPDPSCKNGNHSTRIDANLDFLSPYLPPDPIVMPPATSDFATPPDLGTDGNL
jgi:hypothetical protein